MNEQFIRLDKHVSNMKKQVTTIFKSAVASRRFENCCYLFLHILYMFIKSDKLFIHFDTVS